MEGSGNRVRKSRSGRRHIIVPSRYPATLVRKSTVVKVTDLPVEMLANIFSFLLPEEIGQLSSLHSKFNAAAKNPSLWRRCSFQFKNWGSKKISSFCNFFRQYPFCTALSFIITWRNNTSLNSICQILENFKYLTCLKVNMDLSSIVLPPSLQHLSLEILYDVCDKDQFRFLDQCSNIKRLHLFVRTRKLVTYALMKCHLTLTSLYLHFIDFAKEWLPLIANCLSLKELGLNPYDEWEWLNTDDLSNLFESPLSSQLELLYVNHDYMLKCFSDIKFPKLKDLTILTSVDHDIIDYMPVIKGMPKLHTFRFCGMVFKQNLRDFCRMVKSCETLRNLTVKTSEFGYSVPVEFDNIIRELNEGSSEENQWKLSHEYHDNYKFTTPQECNCYSRTKILIDQDQHKRLKMITISF